MIEKRKLGPMQFIAAGAVGKVYRLKSFRLPGHGDLAYKEIHPIGAGGITHETHQYAISSLIRSVQFRDALHKADQADLDKYTTWPLEVVEERGTPVGLVMPLIPREFFVKTRPTVGKSETIVFELSWLSAKEQQARSEGIDRTAVSDPLVRIALLAKLVYAVGRLHHHGAVYGDISLKNVAVATATGEIKLLDCDAAAPLTDLQRKQLHSPFFKPPEMTAGKQLLQDAETDIYKLGLCVIRGMQQGRGAIQAKSATQLRGILDDRAVAVLGRAVGADRGSRPDAKELFDALVSNLVSGASPPVIHQARMAPLTTVRGKDVLIEWASTGGKRVRIEGSNGLKHEFDDSGAANNRFSLRPVSSGPVVLTLINRHGEASTALGDVELFDLPSFTINMADLPIPEIVAPAPVELPKATNSLPVLPSVSTALHPVPQVVLPPTPAVNQPVLSGEIGSVFAQIGADMSGIGEIVDDVARGAPRLGGWGEDIPRLQRSASEAMGDALSDANRRLGKQIEKEAAQMIQRGVVKP